MFVETNPSFATIHTVKLGAQWVFTAMHWDNTCTARRFYRGNNAEVQGILQGTSLKFTQVFSLQGITAGSFNLVDGVTSINPALRNDNFIYGPIYILDYQAFTPLSNDEAIMELGFGPSFMSSIDFLWKYDQFDDFEDQTAFKARIFDEKKEKSYMEDGNFNSFGLLIKPKETLRFMSYNSSVYDTRSYLRVNTTSFPRSILNTKKVAYNTTNGNGGTDINYYELPNNLDYLSKYLFSPGTMHSRKSSLERLYSPADIDNPYLSMHFITKFWHGFESNKLSFNISQTDDSRNAFTFDLLFDNQIPLIIFQATGSLAKNGLDMTYPRFTLADGYKEYVLSIALLNSTTNHTSTEVVQRKVNFRMSIAESLFPEVGVQYATIDGFQFIDGKGYTFEMKNQAGTEVSVSEIRFGDGGLNYDLLTPPVTNDQSYSNLEGTTKMAIQCANDQFVDLSTYQCTSTCDAAFTKCYQKDQGISCASSQSVNLVGRKCTASCDVTKKDLVVTTTTQTKECTSCLDRYCEKCPEKSYKCETYKKGIIVNPKYTYFNYSDTTVLVRFERLVNFSRLGEYTNSSFITHKVPQDYQFISNNKTGNFDIISYLSINKTLNETNLAVNFTRVVNWNYGDPKVFYTIDNTTRYIYTGWYDNKGFTDFTKFTGQAISNTVKILVIGGVLFDPLGFTQLIKVWSYTQFFFYLNIELPLCVKAFIDNFRWSVFQWFPNLFENADYYCFIDTFKFEQNSLNCSLWKNLGHNIFVWGLLVIYKIIVKFVTYVYENRNNWYLVKFKRTNDRLNMEFLWKLVDAHQIEVLLYIFLYFKQFKVENPGRADHIAGYLFSIIYLGFMAWTSVIISLFLRRLNPAKLTEDEASLKALHLISIEKVEFDKDGNKIDNSEKIAQEKLEKEKQIKELKEKEKKEKLQKLKEKREKEKLERKDGEGGDINDQIEPEEDEEEEKNLICEFKKKLLFF